jgi:hypothetical protein
MKKSFQRDLTMLENSYIFLNESISYYKKSIKEIVYWPFTIFLIIQSLELLLKNVLKTHHPILIYENIDNPKNTVSISQALDRLINISKIQLDTKEVLLIRRAIKYRNLVLHYEVSFNANAFNKIYNQIFEFMHYFHTRHLNSDLHNHINKHHWLSEAKILANFKNQIVHYHDQEMNKEIPSRIIEFQLYDGLLANGKLYKRIRFGEEDFKSSSNYCPDCGCLRGQFHIDYCDIERCPVCKNQFLSCDCNSYKDLAYIKLNKDSLIEK